MPVRAPWSENDGASSNGKFINITYRAKDMAGGVYALK